MVKITSSPNCGNSPKMAFIRDFNIAFAKADVEVLLESVTDDIVWNLVGDKKIEGKKDFADELNKMKSQKVSELILYQILSHGKEGAANGVMIMQNGKKYAFSDFYQFNNAKGTMIKSITTYAIKIK